MSKTLTEQLSPDPSSPDYFLLPPLPGDERAPVRVFKVVNELATLECIYEGRGLTLERAIDQETQYYADGASDRPYDRVFYEGEIVAAVVRNFGDGKGTFKVLPIGEAWVWHVNDMDDMERLEPDDEEEEADDQKEEEDTPAEPEPEPALPSRPTRGMRHLEAAAAALSAAVDQVRRLQPEYDQVDLNGPDAARWEKWYKTDWHPAEAALEAANDLLYDLMKQQGVSVLYAHGRLFSRGSGDLIEGLDAYPESIGVHSLAAVR